MITRNPNTGRHAVGTAIAKSGTKPPKRTGPAGPKAPGAKTYKANMPVTSATLMQTPSRSSSNNNYKTQMEQWTKQSPEPFRNNQPSANPNPLTPKDSSVPQSGANGGRYSGFKGNRISESIPRSQPQRNTPAVGVSGAKNSGMGSNNGKVVAPSQPVRKGNVYNQPRGSSPGGFSGRGGAPSFYGR